ncbi:STIP1 homology and U box-containing protein [Lachnellula subtilissima]|uniref:STIP1 homology and U box-containing protein n=1 Tax=Lachnellula subtilissima TaxID=602034 RepID=A0A8H8U4Y6_9HELO|nr:STIP1 homology and U box-containing protein [Lachnellula subtilissima]
MALLKLSSWARVITASSASIALLPENMKAYYYLAQAQIALHETAEAVVNSRKAHALCVKEIEGGGKGGASLGVISQLVMRCLKEDWERREEIRLGGLEGTLRSVVGALERERDGKIAGLGDAGVEGEGGKESEEGIRREYEGMIADVRATFEAAGKVERKKVPDWAIDAIQFGVMLDPVVTKTGNSYERSSIMEHLKRSPTDPLTRDPLRVEDLRPNLALKSACEEFLKENGWAVDW